MPTGVIWIEKKMDHQWSYVSNWNNYWKEEGYFWSSGKLAASLRLPKNVWMSFRITEPQSNHTSRHFALIWVNCFIALQFWNSFPVIRKLDSFRFSVNVKLPRVYWNFKISSRIIIFNVIFNLNHALRNFGLLG